MNKYFSLLKEQFLIALKLCTEYKPSLYASLLNEISFMIVYVFFMILFGSFGVIPDWTNKEYIMYFLISNFMWNIVGAFVWKPTGKQILLRGQISNYLLRPITPFYAYFSQIVNSSIVFVFVNLIIIIPILFFFKYSLINFILMILFLLLIGVIVTLFNLFLMCLEFINFGFYYIFASYRALVNQFNSYPAKIFGYKKVRFVLIFTVEFWIAYHGIDMLNGNFSFISLPLIIGIIFMIIVLYELNIMLWKYAEKKNEGYI